MTPRPISPYGVTKLAGEHLCRLYWHHYDVLAICLRYFTVYGPRQRPDMAFCRFIRAMLEDGEVVVYGDGKQTRDFTYIDDAVEGTMRAALADMAGEVFNIGGGSRISVNKAVKLLQGIVGGQARVRYAEAQKGDVWHTAADTWRAQKLLDYAPKVRLADGLTREVLWLRERIDSESGE